MNSILGSFALSCSLVAAAAVTACSSSPAAPPVMSSPVSAAPAATVTYGTVSNIDVVAVDASTTGVGAVIGGVLGAVVGHQIGGGTGKTLATGAGAVGGALAGNAVEKNRASQKNVYRVNVRLDNGQYQQFNYENIASLRVGDRVRVDNGQLHEL
ncbi:MAG: glycine zipper 2TM domain-containing protein [Burkholderiales bacterium]